MSLAPRQTMEITKELDLSTDELSRMELHTFLNILQILIGELYLLRKDLGQDSAFGQTYHLTENILDEVRAGKLTPELALRLASVGFYFARERDSAVATRDAASDNRSHQEAADNIRAIIDVLTVRLQEFFERQRTGNQWIAHEIPRLNDNFMKFFAAVEKNSRGRYQILFNVAARGTNDYLVNFKVEGPNKDEALLMPPVMQDVFRDLIANARKYTPLGGSINAGLLQNAEELRIVVEDNGVGIHEDEIEQVVEFGFRGRHGRDRKSPGGGFGLTKAYITTRRLGGRMWIESEPGRGTKVTIRLPMPKAS